MKKFKVFQAIFVMYPANSGYANYFTFQRRQRLIKWNPWIVGVIFHPDGTRSLCFAVSATEHDIVAEASSEYLEEMYFRTLEIQKAIGATSNHFAGIIPGRLTMLRIKREKNELRATARNVVQAIKDLRRNLGHSSENFVVVLGCRGFIGKEVKTLLQNGIINVVGVEKGEEESFVFPKAPHVVVNITTPGVVGLYLDRFNSKTVLLNEVYPAPSRQVVKMIEERGGSAYHIAGVKAEASPPFPSSYQGAVPCCAALPSIKYEVIVRKL